MLDLQDLQEKYGRAISNARAVYEKAEAEKRDITAEDEAAFDKWMEEAAGHKKQIDRGLRLREAEQWGDELNRPEERRVSPDPLPRPGRQPQQPEVRTVTCRGQEVEYRRSDRGYDAATDEYRQQMRRFMSRGEVSQEMRAMQMDSDTAGGYLVAPAFASSIIEAVDDAVYIRQLADTMTVPNADSLGRPSRDADIADHDWTVELGTGSADTSLVFGKRELTPHPLAKRIKVSRKLIRTVGMVEGYVRSRLAYKLGVTQEKAFLTGSGAGQPLGLFTASADGISTSRDVSTGNSTTEIAADNLKECYYTLKSQYRMTARWMFHRDGVKQIAKLKDGNGNYLLTMQNNEPGVTRLFGLPMLESEFAPNTFTTGQYVGIIGDFRNYMIVDALSMEMQRLEELYAETNEIGFIIRSETDGMPVLEEAFVRVTLA